MPFTLSHPAAVIPLIRLKPAWFSGTGLIAGSIAPDFEYFMALKLGDKLIPDLFLVHLPVSIFLSVFFVLISPVIVRYLPEFLSRKYYFLNKISLAVLRGKGALIFLSSAILGIISHLLLDELFHPDGINFGISKLWLKEKVLQNTLNVSKYILIERCLSLILLLVVIYCFFNPCPVHISYLEKKTTGSMKKGIFWISILVLWILLALWKIYPDLSVPLSDLAVTLTSAGILSVFTVSLIFKIFIPKE